MCIFGCVFNSLCLEYICNKCNNKSPFETYIKQHILTFDDDFIHILSGLQYDCDWCNYQETLEPNLKQHIFPTHDNIRYD